MLTDIEEDAHLSDHKCFAGQKNLKLMTYFCFWISSCIILFKLIFSFFCYVMLSLSTDKNFLREFSMTSLWQYLIIICSLAQRKEWPTPHTSCHVCFPKNVVVDLSLYIRIPSCVLFCMLQVFVQVKQHRCDKNMKDSYVTWPCVEDILCTPLEKREHRTYILYHC